MVRETARRRATRGAALVEYALVLALLVLGVAGSIRYLEDETGKEVNNQADCISTRPPPSSCQIPPAVPGPDPHNPGGEGDPVSGGPAPAAARVSPPTVTNQTSPPGGKFNVEVSLVLTDGTGPPGAPIAGEIVTAQILVTEASSTNRIGDFWYENCTSAVDGTCVFSFETRWGNVEAVSFRVIALGGETPYEFTSPDPLEIRRNP